MSAPHLPPLWPCLPGRQLPADAGPLAQARARDLVPKHRQVVIHLDRWPRSGVSSLGPVICCPIRESDCVKGTVAPVTLPRTAGIVRNNNQAPAAAVTKP